MATASEQTQIDFILDLLRKGEQRKSVLAKFVKRWQTASVRTFDRRLKAAETQFKEETKRISQKAEESVIEQAEARKTKILTVLERQELLTQIATGKITIEEEVATATGVKIVQNAPTFAERRAAIAELNKMGGDYAPTKTIVDNKGAIRVIRE